MSLHPDVAHFVPLPVEASIQDESLEIRCLSIELPFEQVERRVLLVVNKETQSTRTVVHFLLLNWRDMSVPRDLDHFSRFLSLSSGSKNFVLHCKAGLGRTGVFVVIAAFKNSGRATVPQVLQTILLIRKERHGLIQTAEQLDFVLRAICTS